MRTASSLCSTPGRVRLRSGVLAAMLLASAAAADEQDAGAAAFEGAEEMIVSASRAPRARASVPSFTSVLEAEDLDLSVSPSLADALRFVPGLQLTQEGGRGGRAQIALRGLEANHVVVLIDGIRLNDPTNSRGGSFDPTTLAIVDIERVEVVRGPLSSVYGSDALAGAINIITRRVEPDAEPTASVSGRGGRFYMGSAVAQASSGLGDIAGLSIGASWDTFRDPNSDGGYDGASLKAKLDVELPLAIDLAFVTRIHESSARSFPESSGGGQLATLRDMEDRDVREILFGIGLSRSFGEAVEIELRASRASRREENDSPGIVRNPPFNPFADVPPSNVSDEYERWDVALVSDWQLPEVSLAEIAIRSRLIAGLDGVFEDGESDAYLDFTGTGSGPFLPARFFEDRDTLGVYAELEEQIGDHVVLSGGVRFDSTRDAKDRLSPSAGITIEIPQTPITLFGSYSEGFKRPSFYALGNPLVGDPDLSVEKSRGWEAGLRGHALGGRLRGQVSYFDIVVKDIIIFDPSVFQLRNERRLISRGVELELGWRPREEIDLRAGVTFNPTDFERTSLAPENRSRWRGFAEIVWTPKPWLELAVRALGVGSSKASSFQTGSRVTTLAGYERIDLRAAWRPEGWIEVFVEIENLTDRTYREAVGFESPGIAPRAGATLRY